MVDQKGGQAREGLLKWKEVQGEKEKVQQKRQALRGGAFSPDSCSLGLAVRLVHGTKAQRVFRRAGLGHQGPAEVLPAVFSFTQWACLYCVLKTHRFP